MNQKIEKAQLKLHEAKLDRERKKAKYDAQTVILEGQRNMLENLEVLNQDILKEFMESDRAVAEFNNQLKTVINEEESIKDE